MKSIAIPPDVTYEVNDKPVTVSFVELIRGLLDNAAPFGTRVGARRAVAIETALLAPRDGRVYIDDADHALIISAIRGREREFAEFRWIPSAARAMEKAGWFEILEKA